MSGEVFLMGNSSVTKAAGVIRVSYPANSTLVVKGTSSGKQFAKDTNTTSSAKAYIFLAPIGDASYTLTATNTAGKTVSKQVYVAKDQVQSVVLVYEFVLYDNGTMQNGGVVKSIDHESTYGSASAVVKDGFLYISVAKNLTLANGFRSVNAISRGTYSTLKARVSNVSGNAYLRLAAKKTSDPYDYAGESSSNEYAVLNKTSFTDGEYALDISAVEKSAYYGVWIWGENGKNTQGSCHILRLWLE